MFPSEDSKPAKPNRYVPPHGRRQSAEKAATTSTIGDTQYRRSHGNQRQHQKDLEVLCSAFDSVRCINLGKRKDKWQRFLRNARHVGDEFADKIERFEAVDGAVVMEEGGQLLENVQLQWDATTNARYSGRVTAGSMKTMTPGEVGCALSHVHLWNDLVSSSGETEDDKRFMFILEDDVFFTAKRGRNRFARAFAKAWEKVPEDCSLLYLGFSGRGERVYLEDDSSPRQRRGGPSQFSDPEVLLYRPEYGFHTHAYAISAAGAARLLENLPIAGPVDVWLADNAWFGLSVCCAVISNEGWRLDDGTYEGANLVSQDRKGNTSDVLQSSETT